MHQYCGRALVVALALASASVISLSPVGAQTPADNTKVNKQDRQADATTADQQKENTHDRTLRQKIRQSIMSDKALSTYAHNVKIVSQGGQVTLKGPVRTEDEKRTVEAKATEVAGAGRVINEISIAPAKGAK